MKNLLLTFISILTLTPFFAQNTCLVAYYPFSGDAIDASGNSHDGTVFGATLTTDRFGAPNSAYTFDGTSNYIDIANHNDITGYSAFSISAWMYPVSTSLQQCVIAKMSPNRDFVLKVESLGQVRSEFTLGASYNYCITPDQIPLNTWTHVVTVWQDSTWYLYQNGTLVSQCQSLASPYLPPWTGTQMTIGSLSSTNYFNGKLDDISLYNCALSASDVQDLYNSVGINENAKITIQIYPNPTNDNITILSSEKATYAIYNLQGQELKAIHHSTETATFNINDLPGGVYILKVMSKNGITLEKFIKE